MPPAPSPGSQASRFTPGERAARVRFRRAVALMLMTLVLPGSAQLVAGNRKVGLDRAADLGGAAGLARRDAGRRAASGTGIFFQLALDPAALLWLRLLLMALAIGWALLFFDAWRLGQPLTLNMAHRRAAIGVNGVLCF